MKLKPLTSYLFCTLLLIIATSLALYASFTQEHTKAVYEATCTACHGFGVLGAPKLGDQKAWKPRIAQGIETLYQHSIDGFIGESGVMPPKGGFSELSDDQIRALVDYMVAAAQQDKP